MGHRHRSAAHQDAGSCWRLVAVEGAIAHINRAAQPFERAGVMLRHIVAEFASADGCRSAVDNDCAAASASDIVVEDTAADAHLGAAALCRQRAARMFRTVVVEGDVFNDELTAILHHNRAAIFR